VTAQELVIIEKGSTNSIYLNFAIFLLSVSISFFVSIFTVDWFPKTQGQEQHLIEFIVFLVIAILTFLVGVLCGVLWWRTHDTFKETINTIKQRLKIEKVDNPDDEESIETEVKEE